MTKKSPSVRKTAGKAATTSKIKPFSAQRALGRRLQHAGLIALLLGGIAWGLIVLLSQPVPTSNAAACAVTDVLENPCRPWLGAAVNNYTQVGDDVKSQMLYHEQRIGRQLDLIHTYHAVGNNKLTDADLYFAKRANTYLFANWKPAGKWADASGGNSTVNAGIDQMAASVKALAPKKIFITLNHEAENNVSGGANCPSFKGSSGTPAQYRAMWQNVEKRFKQAGATNVVWVMDYMNYPKWDCLVHDLYPGDDLINWIMFNGYGHGTDSFKTNVGHFYTDVLSKNSSTTPWPDGRKHNYLSKPWGIVEWGYSGGTSAQRSAYFDQVKAVLENNTFPKLKAYMIYDARDKGATSGTDFRVAYDDNSIYSATQVAHYNAFANSKKITGDGGVAPAPTPTPTPTPTKDTVPPTVKLTEPSDGTRVSGKVRVAGTASDNVGVTAVTIRVDGKWVATDGSSPYTFTVDTRQYKDGDHTVMLRAWDKANNMGESHRITLRVRNHSSTVGRASDQPAKATSITSESAASATKPVVVTGLIVVAPTQTGNSVVIWVDGKKMPNNSIDTNALTNGKHTVTILEDGLQKTAYIDVDNPFPLAVLNTVRTYSLPFSIAAMVFLTVIVASIVRPYAFGLESRAEATIRSRQRRV